MGDKWKNDKFLLLSECTNWRNTLRYVVDDKDNEKPYWAIDVEAMGPNPLFPSAAKLHEKADWQNNFNRDNDRKKWMMPNCFQPILRFKLECVGATGAFDPEHNRQLPRAYELTEDGLKSDDQDESTDPPRLDEVMPSLFRDQMITKGILTHLEAILNTNIEGLLQMLFENKDTGKLRNGKVRVDMDGEKYKHMARNNKTSPLGF